MVQKVLFRRGTAAQWAASGTVVLSAGEPGFEVDTGKFKIGNGLTQWSSLDYSVPASIGSTIDSDQISSIISDLGVSGLSSRSTASGTTSSIANDASENLNIVGFKGYNLLKIQTSAAAWVRIYTDSASRTADASRIIGSDPAYDAGVIAEVITAGAETIIMSPLVGGFNNENPVTTNIPISVTNKSGSSAAITVTLTLNQTEA